MAWTLKSSVGAVCPPSSKAKGQWGFVRAGSCGCAIGHMQLSFANANDIAELECRTRLNTLSIVIGAVGTAAVVEHKELAIAPDFGMEA
jgi:hypothetical protein